MSEQKSKDFIHDDMTFLIVGDHPHTGELCHLVGETASTVSQLDDMYLVRLVNCKHLTEGCYVRKKNLKLITENLKLIT